MIEDIKLSLEEQGHKVIENLKYQMTKVRTGRAQASVLDGITIEYYGVPSPLNQVGQVSTPEARLLQIQPFDKTMIADIEKAILGSNIGLTPSNDGNIIRIPFPTLTEERRKEQVKDLKKLGEDTRIAIRNHRRNQNDLIKKSEKDKEISEDESKKFQGEVQEVTDSLIKVVDELIKVKEAEILTV